MKRKLFALLLCIVTTLCVCFGFVACGGKSDPPDNGTTNNGNNNNNDTKLTYDMSDVSFNDATYVYDGTEKTIVISGTLPEGVTVSYTNNKLTDIGTIEATATFTGDDKHNPIPDMKATLTIVDTTVYHTVKYIISDTETVDIKVAHGETVTNAPELPQRAGYNASWDKEFTTVTEDITVNAVYELITYTITYNNDVGTNNASNPTSYNITSSDIILESPTVDSVGHTFDGWYTTADFQPTSKISTIVNGSTGNVILYAKWLNYVIEMATGFTFGYDSVNKVPTLSIDIPNGQSLFALSDLITVSDNCIWKIYSNFEDKIEIATKSLVLQIGHNYRYMTVEQIDNPTLYTIYILDAYRLNSYTYEFINEGVTYVQSTAIEEKSQVTAPQVPEKRGYTFVGWKVQGTQNVVELPYTVSANVTFESVFEVNNYTITYNIDEYTTCKDSDTLAYGETITLPTPSKKGYTFNGWELNNNSVENTFVWNFIEDITVTPDFTANQYTITYIPDGGTIASTTQTVTYDSAYTIYDISRTGYTFKGYTYNDKEFTGGIWNIDNDITIIANWEAHKFTIKYVYATKEAYSDIVAYDSEYTVKQYNEFSGYEAIKWLSEDYTEYTPNYTFKYNLTNSLTLTAVVGYYGSDFQYELKESKVYISGYSSSGEFLLVPDYIKDNGIYYEVYHIYEQAFKNCTSIIEAIVSNRVKFIGEGAFNGCSSLESICLPFVGCEVSEYNSDSSQHLFGYIFGETNYEGGTKTEQIYKIYSTLKYTAYIPSSLKTVKITGGEIGDGAFHNCRSLEDITIDNSATSIGWQAFYNCNNLKSIAIPSTISNIWTDAFYNCASLTDIYINDIAAWCNISGLYSLMSTYGTNSNKNLYLNNELIKDLIIPDSVTDIKGCAFENCTSIESITMGKGVAEISTDAFKNCTYKEIYITDLGAWCNISGLYYLTGKGNIAFYFNDELVTALIIPNGTEKIADSAFYNCDSLTDITIPNSVTAIGGGAFSGCSSLISITIPNNVTSIGNYAFMGCSSLTSVTISNSVTNIGDWAFNCWDIKNVYFCGTASQWATISFGASNSGITNATIYYYSETLPAEAGNYWHYVNNKPVIWG